MKRKSWLSTIRSLVLACCFICLGFLTWDCKQNIKNEDVKIFSDTIQFRRLSQEDSSVKSNIEAYFKNAYLKHDFNGNVLVGKPGKILVEACFGYANYADKIQNQPNTSFQLASVSKQFTAVAILMLSERGLLSLGDKVEKFFPDFPYKGITISMLLAHRSGLPNYMYFLDQHLQDKETPVNNNVVIRLLSSIKPPVYYEPDHTFNYSNTGYLLLAAIVEKASGMPFSLFMKSELFDPLGMTNTFVSNGNVKTRANVATGYKHGWKVAPAGFLDGVSGDKGIYSSITDLYRWDQGLYKGIVVRPSTLGQAFTAIGKKKASRRNYGYGWRIGYLPDSTKLLYHTGWWQGFQTLLLRVPKDSTTVVVLKNRKSGHINKDAILELIYPCSFPADNKREAQLDKRDTDMDPVMGEGRGLQ